MILVIPPGALDDSKIKALSAKGYIVIEYDDPAKIRLITPESTLDTTDWFMAALHALKSSIGSTQQVFIDNLYDRLSKKESNSK